ncbi:DUF2236 domain-containing protein [Mycobacterium koreense]|uniref:ER-bound oxygenase mpaB/mpaB'/Rubber oxygenase catalytic domain-containing protein n=1 Tax=Mycolicibacillus koreensis TaxID=1069220 RepID=A0A7I7SGE4_9MYCO|nr:oxygenase MpaB family protein [Mycolicibacillus koreensis]MCV7248339.1 DUF2236 domain-containing protein [Mycolicibacillus koreensis]OSC34292.1 hypothetical protein B8W67_07010 [Mycolicibacillus koreensis]BBY55279.1 hypothetical protein MKOR_25300 [Mycolicibacillus koreensis]
MDLLVERLGKPGRRALQLANGPRADAGYFGPDSVSWKVWGHPVISIAGIRGSIVAVFDPKGAAGVDQHSSYLADPLGRVRRSNMFFIQAVFGDTASAQKIGKWLFNRNASVNGVVPETGEPYVANVPETLLWVYVTGWHGLLQCYQRFALPRERLNDAEIRQFYRESLITADLLGLPPRYVPATPEDVQDYLDEESAKIIRPTAEMTKLVRFFLRPPTTPSWPMAPVNPFLRMATYAALSTMPDDWLALLGVRRRKKRWALNDAAVRAALTTADRFQLVDDFLPIAGAEAWGYRHNGLRHRSLRTPVPYEFGFGEQLQQGRGGTLAGQWDDTVPARRG